MYLKATASAADSYTICCFCNICCICSVGSICSVCSICSICRIRSIWSLLGWSLLGSNLVNFCNFVGDCWWVVFLVCFFHPCLLPWCGLGSSCGAPWGSLWCLGAPMCSPWAPLERPGAALWSPVAPSGFLFTSPWLHFGFPVGLFCFSLAAW